MDFLKSLPDLPIEKSKKQFRIEKERLRRKKVKRLLQISVPGVKVVTDNQVLKYLAELAETRVEWSIGESDVTRTGFCGHLTAEA